jgi:hypothetical protein
LKAFCLAFAFVLAALPASANELPQTSNAWRAIEPDLADQGNFKWTVLDNAAGEAGAPAAANGQAVRGNDAPVRAALAQIRAETARVFAEAQRVSAKVQRIRYDLHVSCLVEEVSYQPDPLDNVSMPWLWDSIDESDREVTGTVEMCEVDYSQKVRSQQLEDPEAQVSGEPQPQMRDYKVSFPAD